jgi:hypothetical protein
VQPPQPTASVAMRPTRKRFRVSHRCRVATDFVPLSLSEGQTDEKRRPLADLGTDLNAPVV